MKKVVMIAGPWHPVPPIKGAAVETWIYEVCKRLLRYQPHVISIGSNFHPKREFKDGVFFYRINFGKLYTRVFKKILGWDVYSYNDRIFKLLKKIKPDILHIHNYYNSKELILKVRKKLPFVKVVLHMHNMSSKIDSTFPEVDCFIGVSNFLTREYKKFLKAKVFKTVYNGVDLKKFLTARAQKEDLRKKIEKVPNQKNIFFVGRIVPEKGVDKFIKLANLFKDHPEFRFFCVGEIATKGDKFKYYKGLISFIKKEKLKNIEFWDWVSPFKVHLVYPMADVVVVPSRFEDPFPIVPLEAMVGCGVVIVSAKGGMREYLIDGENAIVIEDYKNFEYIAKERLLELFKEPKKMEKLKKNALNTIKKEFTWEKVVAKLEEVYENLF